jgi:hypothetical protein
MLLIVIFAPFSLSSKINIIHYTKMAFVYNMAKALVKDIILINRVKRNKKNRQKEIIMNYFTNSLLKKVNSEIIDKEIKNI